jgi:hypothetical protein
MLGKRELSRKHLGSCQVESWTSTTASSLMNSAIWRLTVHRKIQRESTQHNAVANDNAVCVIVGWRLTVALRR